MSGVAKQFMRLEGKLSGEILGDCRVRDYHDWIEIDDWSWGLTQQSAHSGGVTQAVPTPITFGKSTDRATTKMLNAMARAERLSAVITLEEQAADQFGLEILLKDVQILEFGLEVKDADNHNEATESWKFDYREISFVVRGTAGERGEKVTWLQRPAWASKDSPVSSSERNKSELLRLAQDLTPGELKQLWEQIKQSWAQPNKGLSDEK